MSMSPESNELRDRAEHEGLKPNMNKPHAAYASPQSQVVSLETLRRDSAERGGGKGANLGELFAAGLDVPPGFCVTTRADRRPFGEAGLARAIVKTPRD